MDGWSRRSRTEEIAKDVGVGVDSVAPRQHIVQWPSIATVLQQDAALLERLAYAGYPGRTCSSFLFRLYGQYRIPIRRSIGFIDVAARKDERAAKSALCATFEHRNTIVVAIPCCLLERGEQNDAERSSALRLDLSRGGAHLAASEGATAGFAAFDIAWTIHKRRERCEEEDTVVYAVAVRATDLKCSR